MAINSYAAHQLHHIYHIQTQKKNHLPFTVSKAFEEDPFSHAFLQTVPSGPQKVPMRKAKQDTSHHLMTVPLKLFRIDLIICPLESILVIRKKS